MVTFQLHYFFRSPTFDNVDIFDNIKITFIAVMFALNMEIILPSRFVFVQDSNEFLKRHNYIITCFDTITNFK